MNRWLVISTFVFGMSAGALHCEPLSASAQEAGSVPGVSDVDAGSPSPGVPPGAGRNTPLKRRYVEAWPEVQGIKGGGTVFVKLPDGARAAQVNVSVIDKRALPVAVTVAFKDDIGHILKQIDPNVQSAFVPVSEGATTIQVDNLSSGDVEDFHVSYVRVQVTLEMGE
jgi:hypothetical protein